MEELKPCPFCGGKAGTVRRWQSGDGTGKDIWIGCENCGVETIRYDTDEDAIAAWNRRTAPENKALICPLLSDAEVKQPCLEGPCPAILNEPLTVEELRKMEETPVYNVTNTELGNFWALIEKVFTDKVKLVTTDHDHILMLHLDAVKSGSVKLYARKPEGSESNGQRIRSRNRVKLCHP